MKRRKLLLSTLAAAVFATSAGALVACGDGVELPTGGVQPGNTPTDTSYTITFVPGADAQLTKIQGNSLTTNKEGKLEGTMPEAEKKENKDDYTFLGWGLAAGQTVPTITSNTFNNHKFDASISVYAVFKENDTPTPPGPIVTDEYDITFLAGENGTLSGETSVKTENGKVKTFPTVTANDGWEWTGWKDADGNQVTSYTTFTKSTSVTAQYVEKVTPGPGPIVDPNALTIQVLVGGTNKVALDSYDAYLEEQTDGRLHDYGKADIALNANDVITFTVNGTAIDFWPDGYSETIAGLVTYNAGVKNTSVTVKADGTYAIYLKEYDTGWVLDVQGEADEPGPGPGPQPETLAIQVLVGGTNKVALDSYDAYLGTQTDGRLHDFGKADIALNANDVITFTVNGTAIDFWPDGYSETIAGLVTYNAGVKNTSVTVKADGTYAIYLKEYDTGWVLDVQGEADEPGPGPGPQPETLAIQVLVGGTNKVALDSYDAYLGTQTDGRLHDFGKADIALNANDVITFNVNGTAIDFYLDGFNKETILSLVTVADANAKNTSVTIKADGTYAIYLKEYASGWVLNIMGEVDEPDPNPNPQPGESKFYLYGDVGGTSKWDTETGYEFGEIDPDANETLAKKYKVEVPLAVGDQVKIFKTNDQENEWAFNNVEEGCLGENIDWNDSNLEALKAGTFTFYLKIGTDGGSSVWINFAASEQPGPSPEDPDDLDVGQYIKVGDEFTKLTAGTPDATKNEAEYYNVQLELTKTTTIKLWAQNATGGAVRNINALKINGVEKFGYNQYGQTGTDHYDLEAGNYEIHYKVYKDGWVELDISKEIEIGDAIVISAADAGKCATITVNGQSIKLYIKEGDNIVDLANNSTFRIYAWSGLSTAGYPGTVITSEMNTLTGSFSNVKFLINKGGDSTKTADLSGISGDVWVITYAVGGGSVAPGVVQA